ncbi:hypothetical protein Glove_124g18 [Diversispora epigaea]|uniref:Uncharacterized protein n=1 Tax=Diversispora epigaea TaxID=1348612 RepID=A0A397J2Z0_9GLOM|nr:hypothetical protein Glove_124g18 [Diversispora epigaea]
MGTDSSIYWTRVCHTILTKRITETVMGPSRCASSSFKTSAAGVHTEVEYCMTPRNMEKKDQITWKFQFFQLIFGQLKKDASSDFFLSRIIFKSSLSSSKSAFCKKTTCIETITRGLQEPLDSW